MATVDDPGPERGPGQTGLARIFARQLQLQNESFGYDFTTMTVHDQVAYAHWNVTALVDELHEALHETSWKPWAKDEFIDVEPYSRELIDALHFLVNLFLVVGKTAEDVERMYFAKAEVNKARQDAGYHSRMGKCPTCGRAEDEPES